MEIKQFFIKFILKKNQFLKATIKPFLNYFSLKIKISSLKLKFKEKVYL